MCKHAHVKTPAPPAKSTWGFRRGNKQQLEMAFYAYVSSFGGLQNGISPSERPMGISRDARNKKKQQKTASPGQEFAGDRPEAGSSAEGLLSHVAQN